MTITTVAPMSESTAFVAGFVREFKEMVEQGMLLPGVEQNERESFIAAANRIIAGLQEHGEAAMGEAEKLLSMLVEYDEDGALFPADAPGHVKEMFFEILERAGSLCNALAA